MTELNNYKFRGARALVLLHEEHLKAFVTTWQKAKAVGVTLPPTTDPEYHSMETLLRHIVGAARGYLRWCCERLALPDPQIREAPSLERIEAEVDEYLAHLLEQWRLPLAEIEEERFYGPGYPSGWGIDYCVESMLEHAVVHPMRHTFQLEELIKKVAGGW